jgi:hypothetical protein
MTIIKFDFGKKSAEFNTTDTERINEMINNLHSKTNDISTYEWSDGTPILSWPNNDAYDYDEEYEDYHNYSPSAPWNAPGMSVSDFIR